MEEIVGKEITGYQHEKNLQIFLKASIQAEGFRNNMKPDEETVDIIKAEVIGAHKRKYNDKRIN